MSYFVFIQIINRCILSFLDKPMEENYLFCWTVKRILAIRLPFKKHLTSQSLLSVFRTSGITKGQPSSTVFIS